MLGCTWITAGVLSYLVPPEIAPWLYPLLGLPGMGVAILLEQRMGCVRALNPDPLLPLTLQLLAVQLVAFPVVAMVWDLAPPYMPVAFAAIVGAHLLPFQWVYRTPVYGIVGFVVAVGPYVLAIVAGRDSLHYTGFLVGGTLLIGAAFLRSHAKATWEASQALPRTGVTEERI